MSESETVVVESVEPIQMPMTVLDITGAAHVEVRLRGDGSVMWVNVDGICRLRICQIAELVLEDARPGLGSIEIEKMGFGTRAFNVLTTEDHWRAKFGRPCPQTAAELATYHRGSVMTVRNCGRKTLEELEVRLREYGLQFDRHGIRDAE